MAEVAPAIELTAVQVSVDTERSTPDFTVLSVSLGWLAGDEQQVLSIQRAFGDDADSEGICLVLSPSQQCSYRPFLALVLGRHAVRMELTQEAAEVFGASTVRVAYSISESLFHQVRHQLSVICENEVPVTCDGSTA